MIRRVTLAFIGFAIVIAPAYAQDEKLREVKGVIRSLDLKTGVMTLQSMSSDSLPGFSLAAKQLPVVDVLGKPSALSDLREGLRIVAKVRNDADVVSIRIDGPNVHGIIKQVDEKKRSITFKDLIAEKTVTLPIGTPIVSQGAEVGLADCKVGGALQLLYSLDKKTILQAQVGKGTHSRDPYLRLTRYYGILAEIDHARMDATIFVQSTDAGAVKSYTVAPDAYLRVMYHQKAVGEVTFKQFAKWVKVHYFVDRDTGRIINIDADLPVMTRRKVTKIDAAAITVEDERKDRVIPLAADVQVISPRGEGRLADVLPERIVNCGLTLDREKVRVIYMWDR